MDIKQFTQRIKFVKRKDLLSVFPMMVGFFASVPFRILHKNIWLICERENEARDNGYWFFKYLCEKHPEIETVYAINKNGVDFEKVSSIGKTIQFGSIPHWKYYFSSKWNISSQKEGKPNPALCYVLEVYLGARKNRIYLKHGIIKDSQRWIFYDVSKITMMCTASYYEQKYIQDHFGYPKNAIKLVGLARFDNLLSDHEVKRQILVMPTMREWLREMSSDTLKFENTLDFKQSEYYLTWTTLLNSNDLLKVLEKHNIKLLFYPHPSMQKYINDFESISPLIEIASDRKYDIQQLLMESALLITDYSSIYFDFAYMDKPILYYQFDYEKYRKGQYQEGYFSYEEDGFGPVIKKQDELIRVLNDLCDAELKNPEKYHNRLDEFFAFHDTDNCKRIYEAIIDMEK